MSREQEFRLALLALFLSATDIQADDCAKLLDAASAAASTAAAALAIASGATDVTRARFGAARLLNGLCGACGRCPRGKIDEPITRPPPRHAPERH